MSWVIDGKRILREEEYIKRRGEKWALYILFYGALVAVAIAIFLFVRAFFIEYRNYVFKGVATIVCFKLIMKSPIPWKIVALLIIAAIWGDLIPKIHLT
jgi:hypothetical protein